jgi:hypothetical protein
VVGEHLARVLEAPKSDSISLDEASRLESKAIGESSCLKEVCELWFEEVFLQIRRRNWCLR